MSSHLSRSIFCSFACNTVPGITFHVPDQHASPHLPGMLAFSPGYRAPCGTRIRDDPDS